MADALSPGMVVAGTFEVERLLGRGGMGEVWLGRHQRLAGKQVAIKVLHTQGELPAEALARFRREAEIAVRLEHPNIVQVLDFNSLPSGQPFIVMELLKGESLAARIRRGPLSPEETAKVIRQVGSALHAAHAAGVVHRDLKPENIFLVPTGLGDQAKVLDFGISKLSDGGTMQTTDSVLMGTPLYMSPEQALGQNRDVTPQSDVFSLGSIVYECLTGKAPFEADNIAKVVFRIAYEPHRPLRELSPQVPPSMADAVEHALQKDRAARTVSVAAFVLELTGEVLGGPGPTSAKPGEASGVLLPGARVDEQMMSEATMTPSSNIQPKAPLLATPQPSPAVLPVAPAPSGGGKRPMALIAGAALVVGVAVTTFVVAGRLEGATAGVDAGLALAPLVDAGAAASPEVDAGALAAVDEPDVVDAGPPVPLPPLVRVAHKPLTPPSGADAVLLKSIEADLAAGKWDEVAARRSVLLARLVSPEGIRDFHILLTEVACKRGDIGLANGSVRQLDAPAARELARKRCSRHRAWSLD